MYDLNFDFQRNKQKKDKADERKENGSGDGIMRIHETINHRKYRVQKQEPRKQLQHARH